jgi:uncharacterized protein (DUF1684 family)
MMNEDELKRSEIERERQEKDGAFKYAHESPIPHEERDTFEGLKYYPVNAKYRFTVRLQKYSSPDVVVMATSTGTQQGYLRYGSFELSLDGKEYRLQVFKPEHSHGTEESLFVPFRDKTSGSETYGAGRYLDIPENETGIYELDFNKAYNPFCAYNPNYVCPMAPRENWLDIKIEAGEKLYRQH